MKQHGSANLVVTASLTATATVRTCYFSRHHIFSATHSVEKARAIEESRDQPLKQQEHRMYVINAIISSAVFVEAAINEVYQDVADGHGTDLALLKDESKELMKKLWKEERKFGPLQKYQLALDCVNQPRFDTRASPYKAANLVIGLRNALVHPRPHDIDDKDGPKIVDQLHGERFRLNPLTSEGSVFFPHRCLGYGCAKWALEACERFVADFDERVGLQRTLG